MEKYNQLTPEIIAQIQAVSDHVLTGDDINADFARDEMPIILENYIRKRQLEMMCVLSSRKIF